jgi:hypothetical protein
LSIAPERETALLDATRAGLDDDLRDAYRDLLRLIGAGTSSRDAVAQVTATFSQQYAALLAPAFSEILAMRVGSASVLAVTVSGVALSRRLYAETRKTGAVVAEIVRRHTQGFADARRLALDIYEGYGFRDTETLNFSPRNPKIPKYLREIMRGQPAIERDLATVMARIQVNKLKTPALKAGYLQAIKAVESGAGQARLNKALDVAFHERMRYFANRIAQTELHRAFSERRAQEIMDDRGIEYVRVMLSGTHPVTDICDLHARMDKYGLGPGVYPKALAPKPPYHPFCRCVLLSDYPHRSPVVKPGAEQAFLRALPADDARKAMGGPANWMR